MIYKLVLVSAAAAQSKRGLEGEAAAANLDPAALLKVLAGNPKLLQQIMALVTPAEATTAETAEATTAKTDCKKNEEFCVEDKFFKWATIDCKDHCAPFLAEKKAAKRRAEIAAADRKAFIDNERKVLAQKRAEIAEEAAAAKAAADRAAAVEAPQPQASGKPTPGDANPKAWNPFAPSTSKFTKLDANTDVEWKLVDGDYVQACKYTFEETEWGTCGTPYTNQQVRTLSADVERFTTGYSCIFGTKGYKIPISCTPSAPAAQPAPAPGAAPAPAVVPAGGCQYEFEKWTDCHYTSETICEQTQKVTKNIAFPPGQNCTPPGYIPNDQGRKICQCTEPWSQELACGYKFTEWSECARTGAEKCERTRQITERTFLYTTGLRCSEVGQQLSEVCTTCDELDVVKACGYEFEDWTTCAVNPFKADGTCHETRKLKSATPAGIAGVPCYSAPAKIPGELGEKVCPCPAAPAPAVVPAAKTTVQQTAQSTQSSAKTTVQEQVTAACAKDGKIPDCGSTCQAGVQYRCVCPAGQVLKGQTPPQTCEDEATGKPAANSGAPGKQVLTKDGNTTVAWASNGTEYVQVCKYQVTESACGENKLKSRKISDVEFYSPALGQSCPLASENNVACSA